MSTLVELQQRLKELDARVSTMLKAREGDPAAAADPVERVNAAAAGCLTARFKWVSVACVL
jgi:hypothetical protein